MPTTLDHKVYPQIFSLIVSFAPWPARLRLRATCRACRDAITRDLMSHVALDTEREDRWPGRRTGDGRVTPEPDKDDDDDDDEEDEDDYFDPDDYDPDAWYDDYPEIVSVPAYPGEAVHALPFSLKQVRTIDFGQRVHGRKGRQCVGHSPNRHFPKKRTIRLIQNSESDLRAANIVAFVTLPFEGGAHAKYGSDYGLYGTATKRFVVHVRWDEAQPVAASHWVRETEVSYGHDGRADLVLWRENARAGPPPAHALQAIFGFAVELCDMSDTTTRSRPVTVVGVETLWARSTARKKFKDGVKGYDIIARMIYDRIDRIRFISHEEWLEELGEDREAVGAWPVE
ncbi:hypothetical protein Q8F55_000033 [Vanrija albida]|uniref:F-box domain-containing protein n=1 Tax=Vanrija albida TaxID=181172 RepID=A0ABR3QC50_9TREE